MGLTAPEPFERTARTRVAAKDPLQAQGRTPESRASADRDTLLSLFGSAGVRQVFAPGSTLLLHGFAADAVYLIVSGTVRCCTIDAEGHRQIFRFATRGDILGLADIDLWHFTAEAVDEVVVKSLCRAVFEGSLAADARICRAVRGEIRTQLESGERQLLSMITTTAADRLFFFLVNLAAARGTGGHVDLPMCRRDIADHLGTSVETVSRAFGELKRRGRIRLVTPEKIHLCGAPVARGPR